MRPDEFIRLYGLRAPQIMWLLGAGASAAANVPTAADMIWDFKRKLYCSRQYVSERRVGDLGDPVVRDRLQQHFDALGGFPPTGSDDEYAQYFEAAYPDENDRQRYLAQHTTVARPSFGHFVLGALLHGGRCRVVWTTNFDRGVEDGYARIAGTTVGLVIADPDRADQAPRALNDGRALLGKLHGDFHSRRLRNASAELRAQDERLRETLVESARRYGLAVVGYSGRDGSVMDALEEGIHGGRGYPDGLFWFQRRGSELRPRVTQLLDRARAAGVQAELIEIETFDELMGDLLTVEHDLPDDVVAVLERQRPARAAAVPLPESTGRYPVIRFNAFEVERWPNVARLVPCAIAGWRALREAVAATGADVVVALRGGVIAFGRDEEVRRALAGHEPGPLDLHPIEARRLEYESSELGLLYEAIARALTRGRPLRPRRRRGLHFVTVDPDADHAALAPVRAATGQLAATVPGTAVCWAEAVEVSLTFRLGRLWLIIEPRVWLDPPPDDRSRFAAQEFVRQRTAPRYNPVANRLLEAWRQVLLGPGEVAELRAFGIEDGVDATFHVRTTSAFSWRRAR